VTNPLDAMPALIAGAAGFLFRAATLRRQGAPVSDGPGRFRPSFASHACRALVVDYTAFQRAAGDIPAGERKVLVLAASLAGVTPQPGDRIEIEGAIWSVIDTGRDPAAATWELRVRGGD
jgi:hypothetical protein